MEERIPFNSNGSSIPVSPNSPHRFNPMIPVAARGDMPPPAAPKNIMAASMAGLIFISTASVMPKTIIIAVVGIVPGPRAERMVAKTYMTMGTRNVLLPDRATIFLDKRERVPLISARPKRYVTPSSMTKREELNPLTISASEIPAIRPVTKARAMQRRPVFIFFTNPRNMASPNAANDISAIISSLLLRIMDHPIFPCL